jgi:predicted DNA-binding protein
MTKTTFRAPAELYKRLKLKAIEEGKPVGDLIVAAIEQYLAEPKKDQ